MIIGKKRSDEHEHVPLNTLGRRQSSFVWTSNCFRSEFIKLFRAIQFTGKGIQRIKSAAKSKRNLLVLQREDWVTEKSRKKINNSTFEIYNLIRQRKASLADTENKIESEITGLVRLSTSPSFLHKSSSINIEIPIWLQVKLTRFVWLWFERL